MPSGPGRNSSRRGFTLIELLVVIGIIVILLGILLPVVSTVRKRAQAADTTAEMGKISTAVHNYYQDFSAYPGPIPDSQLSGNRELFGQTTGVTGASTVTSPENLVLGLVGAIQVSTSGPASFTYVTSNPTNLPKGPQSLNVLNPKQYSTYFDPTQAELPPIVAASPNYTSWTVSQGYSPTLTVPEFMDHFSNPHPLLYLRAQVGAQGVVDNMDSNRQSAKPSQYYSDELYPYWRVYKSTTNLSNGQPSTNGSNPWSTPDANTGSPLYRTPLDLFKNPVIQNVARGQDSFILISAGYDGIYGTADDIIMPTN